MSIFVPGLGLSVPVVWKPSPDHYNGRNGYQPLAIVHHRAVSSSLSSIDTTLISSTRQVSANFAIGHVSGRLEIHQYVDLSDGAWCNGDCQQTQYPGQPSNFDNWYGHKGHNERTVSIEHEDQGGSSDATKKGIVTEDILLAGIELDRLMLSGDLAAIRAAGIRIRDSATAAALGNVTPGQKTLIDHHDIAGKLKPYCWKPWQADTTGFPRTRYIAAMTQVTEDDMPALVPPDILGFTATVKAVRNVRAGPKLTAAIIRTTSAIETWQAIGWVKGDVDPEDGSNLWLMRSNGQYEYTSHANLASQPADLTPYSQAQLETAAGTGYADAKAAAALAVAAI